MTGWALTLGHGLRDARWIVQTAAAHGASAVVDVRSPLTAAADPSVTPARVAEAAASAGLVYRFEGHRLGPVPPDPDCRDPGGVLRYERIRTRPWFSAAISGLVADARSGCPVLLCVEEEPLLCHRFVLVGAALASAGVEVAHIHRDGRWEPHGSALRRLAVHVGVAEPPVRLTTGVVEAALRLAEAAVISRHH